MKIRLALLLTLIFSASSIAPSFAAGERFALVIGNAKYPDAEAPLKEPINDARDVADELKRDGFNVDIGENLTGDGDAPRLRAAVRQDQAGLGRADLLLRLRRPVEPPELHDPGRCADLDRGRCPPRRLQPRDGAGRDQQPRRRRQDRADRRLQAQPVRAPVPQLFGRPCAGHRAERHAGDVFGGAVVGDFGQWQRSQPVRAGTAQGNPHPRPDGRGNAEPHPRRRHPRLAPGAGAVDFVVAGRGFLLHPRRRRTAAVEPAASTAAGLPPPPRLPSARACACACPAACHRWPLRRLRHRHLCRRHPHRQSRSRSRFRRRRRRPSRPRAAIRWWRLPTIRPSRA